MRAHVVGLSLGLLIAGAPLSGQSIFGSSGIGLPMEALDGRARALGSFGIGLQGPTILPSDPAAAARVLLPTGVIVAQPSWIDLTEDSGGDHRYFQGTRFPLLGLAYPAFSGTLTVHIASVFDQSFAGERTVDIVLGGTTVPATDRFVQDGSVSMLAAGYARMLGARTAVGLSLGRYSGRIARSLVRDYGDVTGLGPVEPYASSGAWRYSGESITGGISTELLGPVHVAASATWSTRLDAAATGSTEGAGRTYSVPLQLRVGASSALTPGLTLSASAVRADWSVAADEVGGASVVRTVMGVGVGVELSQARLLGREAPLRLGFRRNGLPFSLRGDGAEQVFSGGLALILNESNGVVLATTDLAIERGRRTGGTITEEFWRGTVSVQLSSF
jgi:hypothetical protein